MPIVVILMGKGVSIGRGVTECKWAIDATQEYSIISSQEMHSLMTLKLALWLLI